MGRGCCAVGCDSKMRGATAIVYHRFPIKDPVRMVEWLKLCPPDISMDSVMKGAFRLCSKHFRRDQYLNFNVRRPTLVHNAVPFIPRSAKTVGSSQNSRTPHPAIDKTSVASACLSDTSTRLPSWFDEEEDLRKQTSSSIRPSEMERNNKEEEDEDLTIEVIMKEVDVVAVERDKKKPGLTYESLILENTKLKEKVDEMAARLNVLEGQQIRLTLMEERVHRLSQLTGQAESCICSLCQNVYDDT